MSDLLTILQGDALTQLSTLPDESVQMCCTSPPYWGLRNYNIEGQLGLEKTPEQYVEKLVSVFREVWRVLRKDGTLWLNLGDSYCGSGRGVWNIPDEEKKARGVKESYRPSVDPIKSKRMPRGKGRWGGGNNRADNVKPKDLIGIPWMVAFALRAEGWYLRSKITWCKKVPMPESVEDRPTSATEEIFLLSKSVRYFYDADAVRNPLSEAYANDSRWRTGSTDRNEKNGYAKAGAQNPKKVHKVFDKQSGHSRRHSGFNERWDATEEAGQSVVGSNMRNYWVLGPEPFTDSHFATFPSEVPKRCILAGSPVNGTVLDPFAGSGTTGMVALELGRKAILIELNPEYVKLIKQRCNVTPGLALA